MNRPTYKINVVFANSKKNISKKSHFFKWAVADLMMHKDVAEYGWIEKNGKVMAEVKDGEYRFVG